MTIPENEPHTAPPISECTDTAGEFLSTGAPAVKRCFRFTAIDAFAVLTVGSLIGYLIWKGASSLDYSWNWSFLMQYIFRRDEDGGLVPGALTQGLVTTIRLSIWSTLLACAAGFLMGMWRTSPKLFRRLTGGGYVELVRNTPPLVLVFIFYFFFSAQIIPALGIEDALYNLSPGTKSVTEFLFGPVNRVPSFISAVLTLALYEGAYITEIVRAGMRSVDFGQWEAASALGFTRKQQIRHIIFPQALRHMLPPLAGQFISTIKDSAIVSVISVQELTFQGMELTAATYHTFEVWLVVLAMYFILTFSCSLAVRRLETRAARRG